MSKKIFTLYVLFLIGIFFCRAYATEPEETESYVHQPGATNCLECHEDVDQDHSHAVEVRPDQFPPPSSWPRVNKKVSCVSCHGVLEIQDPLKLAENPLSLRGGPYSNFSAFCFQCHEPLKQKLKKLNVHSSMLTPQNIQYKSCTYCHTQPITSPRTKVSSKDIKLSSSFICASCHRRTEHLGSLNHFEKKLTSRMLSSLKTFEQEHTVKIPLVDNKVSCISCHDPHPKRVLETFSMPLGVKAESLRIGSALSKELRSFGDDLIQKEITSNPDRFYAVTSKDPLLRFSQPQLCGACHGR